MITVEDLKRITKGKLVQEGVSCAIKGVSIDSRSIKQTQVFIAIQGTRFNGHDFIKGALRRGAAAVIVSKKVSCPKKIAVICVKDTTKALGQIAAWHRQRFPIPVIAITGSTGKTTTKDLIAAVLSTRFDVLKNTKTENNHFGVPLTLLKLNSSHQILVLELGTNQAGDIRRLAKIVQPTIAVFTNIGESHLEKLKTPAGVFREKIQLIKFLKSQGTIVINGDDAFYKTLLNKKFKQKIVRYGFNEEADVKVSRMAIVSNRRLIFKMRKHTFTVNSPVVHNVYNALAAISCGLLHKIRYNEIKSALKRFRFREARQEIIKSGQFLFIDDTYNANPLSLRSAIHTLDGLHVKGKKIIVCADMLELGSRSKALHQSAGKLIARSSTDVVLTMGCHARYITQSCKRSNEGVKAFHCSNITEVHQRLSRLCCPGDAILVKGSREMQMERTISFLKNHFN